VKILATHAHNLRLPFTFIERGESTQLEEGADTGGVVAGGVTGAGADAGEVVAAVVGAGVEGLGLLPPNMVDCEKRLLKEFRFGRTMSRSEALVIPNHCAMLFHIESQGVVGMQIPGSNIRSPPSSLSG